MADRVRDQYEAFPYPPRDPRDESKRLIEGSPSHLLEVNHYIFAGRRDFSRPFRALIAGGGTGDGTIMLAQQLADRGCPAEIIHLDLSSRSRAIAEARASARGLRNIEFMSGSLLDLLGLKLGRFDYIDCCGVLHHLPDPAFGLRLLAESMTEGGGIGLMVYGALGRTGVYDLQEVLRTLCDEEADEVRLDIAKRLLRQLPPTNWFARNPAIGDHLKVGDAGLYDLLLHSQDRAYTVPELAALVGEAGLEITSLIEPWRYRPESYLGDGALLKRLGNLDPLERARVAELIAGNHKTHVCYVVRMGRSANAVARPDNAKAVPVLRDGNGPALARGLKPGGSLTVAISGVEAKFALPRRAGPILARIDGQRDLERIFADLQMAEGGQLTWAAFKEEFDQLYMAFNNANKLFLVCPS
ncbi:MAG: class I SAM-dependent methyltransferase [Dongiaceae bacterium]